METRPRSAAHRISRKLTPAAIIATNPIAISSPWGSRSRSTAFDSSSSGPFAWLSGSTGWYGEPGVAAISMTADMLATDAVTARFAVSQEANGCRRRSSRDIRTSLRELAQARVPPMAASTSRAAVMTAGAYRFAPMRLTREIGP